MLEKKNELKNKQMKFSLWVEKYRPMSVSQILLPSNTKAFLMKLVEEKEIPNLLFHSSSAGVGKTTAAKALANDIKSDFIYTNMSLENGIDTLRNRISKFATSYSMFGENEGGKKICVCDEFDGSSPALQAAFRGFMEDFQDSCRFILTCNYVTKIIEPLKSRCQQIDFNMSDEKSQKEMKPQIVARLCGILKNEKIVHQQETIVKLVDTFFPDIRRMTNLLQQYSKNSGMIDTGIFDVERVEIEFYNMILNRKLTDARKYLIQKNVNYDELYTQLFHDFIPMLHKDKQGQAIIILAQYQHMSVLCIDKELNFVACLLEIMGIL